MMTTITMISPLKHRKVRDLLLNKFSSTGFAAIRRNLPQNAANAAKRSKTPQNNSLQNTEI
jgi:hypothetical protein